MFQHFKNVFNNVNRSKGIINILNLSKGIINILRGYQNLQEFLYIIEIKLGQNG